MIVLADLWFSENENMHIAERGIVFDQIEAQLVAPCRYFFVRVKRGLRRDDVIVEKILRARPASSAARFCQMDKIIERNERHAERGAACRRFVQPADRRPGISIDVIVMPSPVIESQIEVTAGTQNAYVFRERGARIRRVMNDPVGNDGIEARVGKRQRHHRSAHEAGLGSALAGARQRDGADVDGRYIDAKRGKIHRPASGTASDLRDRYLASHIVLAKFDERLWLDGSRRMLVLGCDRIERMAVVVLLRAVLRCRIQRHQFRSGFSSRWDAARKAASNNASVRSAARCHEKSCARWSAAADLASRSAALSISSPRIPASA